MEKVKIKTFHEVEDKEKYKIYNIFFKFTF